MDMQEKWDRALAHTEIVRYRLRNLNTFKSTDLPYVFLAESSVNIGDTVVRKGKISIAKPSLILPRSFPQFKGFEFDEDKNVTEDDMRTFFLVRGMSFPNLEYSNDTTTIDVYNGSLKKAVEYFSNQMKMKEEINTGLFIGPEDTWQFSALIFGCSMIMRTMPQDMKNLFDRYIE